MVKEKNIHLHFIKYNDFNIIINFNINFNVHFTFNINFKFYVNFTLYFFIININFTSALILW